MVHATDSARLGSWAIRRANRYDTCGGGKNPLTTNLWEDSFSARNTAPMASIDLVNPRNRSLSRTAPECFYQGLIRDNLRTGFSSHQG